MRFTKAKTLGNVKIGEAFVKKFCHHLIVCIRTPRGYRWQYAVSNEQSFGKTIDNHVRPVSNNNSCERLVSKKRLLQFIKDDERKMVSKLIDAWSKNHE